MQSLLEPLKEDVSTEAKLVGLAVAVGQSLQNIQLTKGPRGEQGLIGPRGYQGMKGPEGRMGQHGPAGKDGSKGDPGVDGIDGLDGVSVTDTWIAADNHLVVKLSNGKEIDAGLLDTQSGGNIISTQVSSVEPSWSRNFMIMGS